MKQIKEYISKLSKKQKKMMVGGIACFLLAIIIIGLGASFASTESGIPSYLKDQVVDGISFEKANLVYENGISKYTAEVHNEQQTDYKLKYIDIIFKDSEGNEITKMATYVGDDIKAESARYITASIDEEITDISTIEYVINK